MKVHDLMTRAVMSVRPEASLKEVAGVLASHRVSGLPVVDEADHVVGVVSEGDILEKERGRPERGGILAWLSEWEGATVEAKLAARTAGEAMTSPAVTIRADQPVSAAASLMLDSEVNRLPVLDRDGRLVGIVTRADLVRAFTRSDAEILHEIREEVVLKTLWLEPEAIDVQADQGEVTLRGTVDRRSEAEILTSFVERVPGVVSVQNELGWERDDLERRRR